MLPTLRQQIPKANILWLVESDEQERADEKSTVEWNILLLTLKWCIQMCALLVLNCIIVFRDFRVLLRIVSQTQV